jgi:hypothetical protein
MIDLVFINNSFVGFMVITKTSSLSETWQRSLRKPTLLNGWAGPGSAEMHPDTGCTVSDKVALVVLR